MPALTSRSQVEERIRLAVRALLREDAQRSELYHNHLDEKEKQAATVTDLFGGDEGGGGDSDGGDKKPEEPSKTQSDDVDAMKKSEVTADDVIERLNAIRSGRSLKDENLKRQMEQYVESLSSAERVALLAFLKGISQLVTGEVPSEKATEPSDDPADVHMHKQGEDSPNKQTKHVQPNVIKPNAPVQPKRKGAEDTSAPVPITPQKRG